MLGILFVSASNIFAVYPAQKTREAIDSVFQFVQNNPGQNDNNLREILLWCAVVIIGASLLRGVFMYFMRQALIVMSRHIEYDMKNEIYDQYQKLHTGFYRKNNTGDLMNRISEDVSRVRMFIGPSVMYVVNTIVTFIVVIYAMFRVNPVLSAWTLLPLPFLSFAIFYVNNIIEKRSDKIQQKLSELTSFAQESFSGIRVIKSFAAEKRLENAMQSHTRSYQEKQMSLAKVDMLFFPAMFFLTGLSTIITVFVGGLQVAKNAATVGNIAEFVIYINMLVWPVASLGWVTSLVQRAIASQKRILEFLNEKPEIVNQEKQEDFHFNREIRFENVSFTYDGMSKPAIEDVSFELKKGNTLAILGGTGSGKSTLANLFMRVMDPDFGSISVDGVNLKNLNLLQYRKKIGYVPQDVFLFSDTLSANIGFGIDNPRMNEIEAAAGQADLAENISSFPDKYQTIIGERGITLSGGQKQRTAIARALIKNPDILIFDDSLSAVDTRTEAIILENLKKLSENKTLVIISHRASAVKDADTILVFDKGRIVEQGSHTDLLENNGFYYGVFRKQMAEELQVAAEILP